MKRQMNHCPETLMISSFLIFFALCALIFPTFGLPLAGQDPAEPQGKQPAVKLLPPPAGRIARASINIKSLRATIEELVSCGTRLSISSWDDPHRGVGCGRDKVVAKFNSIAKTSGCRLQVVVDKFQATSPRTSNAP